MRKILALLLGCLFITACATGGSSQHKVEAKKAPPSAAALFKSAQKDLETGKKALGVKKLNQILKDEKGTELYAESAILLGNTYFQNKDFQKAYEYYLMVVNGDMHSQYENEAIYLAARTAFRLGKVDDTLSLTETALKTKNYPENRLADVQQLRFKALEQKGNNFEILRSLVLFSAQSPNKQDQDAYRLRAIELVENKLNENELSKVASDSDFGFARGYAMYRLGEINLENQKQDQARRYFGGVSDLLPETDLAVKAKSIIDQLEAAKRVDPKTIGVVLPLSGKYAGIGQKTLRGIEMGLGLNDPYPSNFKLAIVDSEANPDAARRGVERLVTEDNSMAIIGSLLSKTAVPVAAKAQELGVPSIALSQKAGITEVGNNVFRNALTSEMQVRELARVAIEEMGMKRFAILYPNDQYGVEYANIFWDEVMARGGSIHGAQPYDPKETDFREPIQRLVGLYYIEARQDEYTLRYKQWSDAQTRRTARLTPPDDLLPPIVDFDAIFVPDSIKALGQIAPMLAFNNVKGVKLLGTNLWNTPGLVKRLGPAAESTIFVDSFANNDPSLANSQFVKQYKSLYNEEPSIFEVQAYDAALMLRQLVLEGANSREALSSKLSSLNHFPASIGYLSMAQDREIQRPLVALTVMKNEILPLQSTQKKNP